MMTLTFVSSFEAITSTSYVASVSTDSGETFTFLKVGAIDSTLILISSDDPTLSLSPFNT